MQNTAKDLRNHLFAELERLGDENLTEDQLDTEVKRAKAVTIVAGKAIELGKLELAAAQLFVEYPNAPRPAGLLGADKTENGGGGDR